MTVKLTISLPDDIAARVQAEVNTSAYIAESVRMRIRTEAVRHALSVAGISEVPAEEYARIARQFAETEKLRDDPEFQAANAATLAAWREGTQP